MSKLRPECRSAEAKRGPQHPSVIYARIFDLLSKRRGLIYGKLDGAAGEHCAMGCYWDRYSYDTVPTSIVDEIAAVNDSVKPGESKFKRWQRVRQYLRIKLATYGIEV